MPKITYKYNNPPAGVPDSFKIYEGLSTGQEAYLDTVPGTQNSYTHDYSASTYAAYVTAVFGGVESGPSNETYGSSSPQPSFNLTVSMPSGTSNIATVSSGSMSSELVSLLGTYNFTGEVELTATFPNGIYGSFSSSSVYVNSQDTSTSTLAFFVSSTAKIGSNQILITAVSGSVTQSQAFTINVTAPTTIGAYVRMSNTNVGIQSLLGVGMEMAEGTPVKAQRLLDRISGNLALTKAQLRRRSLRGVTASVGAASGITNVAGSLILEPTAEGISQVFCMTFGVPVQAAVAGPPTRNTQTWSDNFGQLPGTITEMRGGSFYCFPGARCGSWSLRLDKTQSDVLQMTFEAQALNQVMYSQLSDLGLDTAGYDPLGVFSAPEAAFSIGGVVTSDARSFDITCNKNLGKRDVLNGYLGPNGHYVQASETSGTATLYFSNEDQIKRFMGYASPSGTNTPYGPKKTIVYVPLGVNIVGEQNAAGFANRLFLAMTRCSFEAVGEPIAGPDAIMQEIRYFAYHDTATGTSLQVGVENSQTVQSIINGSTAAPTTPGANSVTLSAVPANDVQPLVI